MSLFFIVLEDSIAKRKNIAYESNMMESGYRKFERPQVLYPLFRGVDTLKGIGGRLSKIIGKRIGAYVIDLTRHAPHSLVRRHLRENLATITDGEVVTLLLTPTRHDKPTDKTSRRPARVFCQHIRGNVELVFFHAKGDYLTRALPLNQARYVSGRAEWYQQKLQIAHPDYIAVKLDEIPQYEPIYALTAGLTAKPLSKAIAAALELVPPLPEWIAIDIKTRFGWDDWDVATRALHRPTQEAELHPEHPVRMRLAYDELLANQLALAMVRMSSTQGKGRIFAGDGQLRRTLLNSLPFALTQAQERVISEIAADQTTEKRMLRLLQGDVGAGKTLVAVMAMLNVVESCAQAALIAPTEILARQHYDSISKMLDPLGVKPCLLVGRMKAKEAQEAHRTIAEGDARVIIGTHALIAEKTQFNDLGLVVIDEQHRFGVRQRLILGDKGGAVDVLAMTATPIPRSLAMTAYGDLDNSILDDKPAGRAPITTTVMPITRIDDVVTRLRQAASPRQKVYWVCPLIEESDKIDVAAAEARFTELSASLPALKPRLIHGRMKSDEREDAMQEFRHGATHLLIATSLIEVGRGHPRSQHYDYRIRRAFWVGAIASITRACGAWGGAIIMRSPLSCAFGVYRPRPPCHNAREQ